MIKLVIVMSKYIKTNIFIKFIQKVSRIFLILFFYMDLEVLR